MKIVAFCSCVILGLKMITQRPGRYLKTFLEFVAPPWLNMSPIHVQNDAFPVFLTSQTCLCGYHKCAVCTQHNVLKRCQVPRLRTTFEGSTLWEGGHMLSSTAPAHKMLPLGTLHRILSYPADPAETVAATAAQTPPSTRAGGQDDVS